MRDTWTHLIDHAHHDLPTEPAAVSYEDMAQHDYDAAINASKYVNSGALIRTCVKWAKHNHHLALVHAFDMTHSYSELD